MSTREAVLGRVSRETADRLDLYVEALTRWQRAINLVSSGTLSDIWSRHIDDSLQLAELVSDASGWLDMGSGAGLPGLIVSAAHPTRPVWLVESDSRKCAFLRAAAKLMDLRSSIHETRIEAFLASGPPPGIRIVTARALAPLVRLIDYAQPLLRGGAIALFPKGRNVANELTEARESWRFEADLVPSRTDPHGHIVRITGFSGARHA